MSERSYGNEPRNYFITVLIQKTSELEEMIFVNRATVISVFPAMQGIILMLNQKAQKDLKDLYGKIEKWDQNKLQYDKHQVRKAYGELMSYLHTGYLKEVNIATPRFGMGKLGLPQNE